MVYNQNQYNQNQYNQSGPTGQNGGPNTEYERFNSNGTKKGSGKGKKSFVGIVALIVVVAVFIVGANSMVITKENQYKLIRQFGRVQRVISQSGLSFKMPFIETVDVVPRELLLYDLPASDVITSDKKSMIVDSYVLWRVTDPLKFAQTLSGSVANAERRIDTIVYNATKNTISNMKQDEVIVSRDGKMTVVSDQTETDVVNNDMQLPAEEEVIEIKSLTEEIMDQIANVEEQYGIEIVTVEVKKLDLPDDNKQAVYTRMISERENIAAQYTAEGKSQAKIIENTTDKEVSIMLSNAEAQAEAVIAEGEAEYMRILSDAYSDPDKADFYSFVRALDALEASMNGNKTIILSDDSPIAQIFNGQY